MKGLGLRRKVGDVGGGVSVAEGRERDHVGVQRRPGDTLQFSGGLGKVSYKAVRKKLVGRDKSDQTGTESCHEDVDIG